MKLHLALLNDKDTVTRSCIVRWNRYPIKQNPMASTNRETTRNFATKSTGKCHK